MATHTPPAKAPKLGDLGLEPARPLLIVDVDEVLGLFVEALEGFLALQDVEFRVERFSLYKNMYRAGTAEPVDIKEAKRLHDHFLATGGGEMRPAPGGAEALANLSAKANVLILSNAPASMRLARARWLGRHRLDYPFLLNVGPKGPLVAALAAQAQAPAVFIDDMMSNLDSVELAAPAVHRFQMVADSRLRPIAPTAPERHRRIDLWPDLQAAVEELIAAEAVS